MLIENPVTKARFELNSVEADFFNRALIRFHENQNWSAFETFAFGPASPIYRRRQTFGRLAIDPLYRALQDMWLQLGVNLGEVQDDRARGEKGFCHAEEQDQEQAGRAPVEPIARR